MNLRDQPLVVVPGKGIGPFLLGLGRTEVQALTREPIHSYFPQDWSTVRSDAHDGLGVTVSYDDDARANHIAGYTRVKPGKSMLEFEGERLRDTTRSSLVMLLDLLETPHEDTGETVVAPALALTFGFREPDAGHDYGPDDPVDWVVVRPLAP
jgi:hypothetical protein